MPLRLASRPTYSKKNTSNNTRDKMTTVNIDFAAYQYSDARN